MAAGVGVFKKQCTPNLDEGSSPAPGYVVGEGAPAREERRYEDVDAVGAVAELVCEVYDELVRSNASAGTTHTQGPRDNSTLSERQNVDTSSATRHRVWETLQARKSTQRVGLGGGRGGTTIYT